MFPNVRLMIAAVAASVVALSCGFGVFAALRVNHEPLARLPSVAAPAQFIADNPAPTAVTIAAQEPFDSRFQFRKARDSDDEPEDTAAIAPAAMPPAAPAAEPTERTALTVDEPEPDSAPSGAPEVKSSAQDMHAPEVGGDPVQDQATMVAVTPPADQSQPADEAARPPEQETEIAPKATSTSAAKIVAKTPRKVVRKIVKQQRVATHRIRRSHARAIAQFNDQGSGLAQTTFQTAPGGVQGRPVRGRRTAHRTAVGGPFVNPTGD
jgi:hypothetical protein